MYKDRNKSRKYSRLTMAIRRAKKKNLDISNLLAQRKSLIESEKISRNPDKKKNQPLRIILGTSDFKKLRQNNAVVIDKSLLIKAILDSPSMVSLITRPRRWGKSLNLNMIKTFFEIENGVENRKLFTDLNINNCQYAMDKQGCYPVILLNLKETKGNNYKEVENNIIKKVQDVYEQHTCLKTSKKLRTDEKRLFQNYLEGKINKADLQNSIFFLSKLLFKHFEKNVYILIDEYDEVINNSYLKFGQKSEEFESILDLVRGILASALKENEYLERGVLTGIFKIAKASLSSGLNNISEYSLLDERFSEYYGFTQNEVDDLLTNKIPNIVNREDIKNWYNGYKFGKQVVYNPFSIMHCLSEEGLLKAYWIDSGDPSLINQSMLSDENQKELQTLLCGKSLKKKIYEQIAFDQIKENKDLFYSLLVFAGYLNPVSTGKLDIYELSIPSNKEIRKIYEDRVIEWVAKKLNISVSDYDNFISLLLEERIEKFSKKLNHYLLNSTSSLDLIKERDYHNLMGGLLSPLSSKYLIESNRESGYGRYDHILLPELSSKKDVGFILEYKNCKREKDLEKEAKLALNQIEKKLYETQVKKNSWIKKIIKVGLAFWERKVVIEHKKEEI